jgi:ADP-dependent phosphofructokinase/glucokinase
MAKLNIKAIDVLLKEEITDLINSFYHSDVSNKHKKIFEVILNEICA